MAHVQEQHATRNYGKAPGWTQPSGVGGLGPSGDPEFGDPSFSEGLGCGALGNQKESPESRLGFAERLAFFRKKKR